MQLTRLLDCHASPYVTRRRRQCKPKHRPPKLWHHKNCNQSPNGNNTGSVRSLTSETCAYRTSNKPTWSVSQSSSTSQQLRLVAILGALTPRCTIRATFALRTPVSGSFHRTANESTCEWLVSLHSGRMWLEPTGSHIRTLVRLI